MYFCLNNQGFVAYFDVIFDCGANIAVSFSTGPDAPPTHWKQTVFYLEKPFEVIAGTVIRGQLFCSRSGESGRNLFVTLSYEIEPLDGVKIPTQSQVYKI